jgi:hypothetical protein
MPKPQYLGQPFVDNPRLLLQNIHGYYHIQMQDPIIIPCRENNEPLNMHVAAPIGN